MAPSKPLAEWFWVDRWTGSSAFALPLEARGLYREMLTQAWRRSATLPNDHEKIRRLTGCTMPEWKRAWPQIEHYWRVDGEHLVNDTQADIYREAMAIKSIRSEAGQAGNKKRWGDGKTIANGIANGIAKPIANDVANGIAKASPLSLTPEVSSKPLSPLPPSSQINGRSKRPIFVGNRLKVFEWQLDDLLEMLGKHADSFKLDMWFQALDRRLVESGEVLPKRDGGAWLTAQTMVEVRRRGLPIAGEKAAEEDPYAGFPTVWNCKQCGCLHEGSKEDKKRGVCTGVAAR